MRMKDFRIQDTEQYNLRKSNMLLMCSQGDLQSSLLSSKVNQEVNGTMDRRTNGLAYSQIQPLPSQ